jgi:hypothetical protein
LACSEAADRAAFERAVSEYRLTGLTPPADVLSVVADSLSRTGLFLLGEVHGVAQTPNAILGLASALDVRALAFEWSHDELEDIVRPVLTSGAMEVDALWSLPPTADVFSGDGRLTAGHVRLLEHLADRLDRIVLLDRRGAAGSERERELARRLLDCRQQGSPLLAVIGVGHVVRSPVDGLEPVGLLVEREVPGVSNGMLAPSSGRAWFHGEHELDSPELPAVDVVFPIGVAEPAVVPRPVESLR